MKVYRYNLDQDKFNNFVKSNSIKLLGNSNIHNQDDLQKQILEDNNNSRSLIGLVDKLLQIKKDDYIWLRSGKLFACGKFLTDMVFDGSLKADVDLIKVNYDRVPSKIKKLTGGRKLILLKDKDVYGETFEIFREEKEKFAPYADEGLITISNNNGPIELAIENKKGSYLTPALRENSQIAVYRDKDDIKITYKNKNKKNQKKANDFELILEMDPKKDKNEANRDNLLPMKVYDFNENLSIDNYNELLNLQMKYAYEFFKTSMENVAKINIKFWQEYLKIFEK